MKDKKELNIFVGTQIRAAREQEGFTQEKLSELIGISTNHLSAIERGVYGLSLENLWKICRLLNVSSDFLLFGDTPGKEEITIAHEITSVNPKYKEQIVKGLEILLTIAEMK